MKENAFDRIYTEILDAQCGVYAIQEIMRDISPAGDSLQHEHRQLAVEWVTTRITAQLNEISSYAEAEARAQRRAGA
jgi:hypothetical protein